MTPLILIAPMLLGVESGWQPLPEGGMEYIIQIGPTEIDLLKQGEAVQSDIPSSVGPVRAYRVILGTGGDLPREQPLPTADKPPSLDAETTPAETNPPGQPFRFPSEPNRFTPADASPSTPPERQTTFRNEATSALATEPSSKAAEKPNTPKSLDEERKASQNLPTEESQKNASTDPAKKPSKDQPWWPLTLTIAALAASISGNVYLVWILREAHHRYRKLAGMFGAKNG